MLGTTSLLRKLNYEPRRTGLSRTMSFVSTLLGGAALGAVGALLFAPSKGTDLRRQLADRTQNLTRQMTQGRQGRQQQMNAGGASREPSSSSPSMA